MNNRPTKLNTDEILETLEHDFGFTTKEMAGIKAAVAPLIRAGKVELIEDLIKKVKVNRRGGFFNGDTPVQLPQDLANENIIKGFLHDVLISLRGESSK